ncbi:MAG: flagellar hook-associated protein FlgK, partial [Lachnospiraceae bacterium]|nr:flagellar hook-associated protein FlgK [Lachnospiraceae bacterium]
MPNTFFGLSISKSGLYASMGGITTTAHNIANTETNGYTRQVVEQEASSALRVNHTYGMVGSGVDVTGVVQIREEYYDVKYRSNNTLGGEYSTKQRYMAEVENYFNEIRLEGFTTTYNSLFDSIQELEKNPSSLTTRTQVTNFAQNLCEYIN